MSLKKIFPLLALGLIAIVGFAYVKPVVDSVLKKIAERDEKQRELQDIERVRDNFDILASERRKFMEQESGRMLSGYLPTDPEQERITDIVSRLSMSSGVILNSVMLESSNVSKTPSVIPSASVIPEGAETPTPPVAPRREYVSAEMDFWGGYESMRNLFSALSSSGRSNKVVSFSIRKEETQGDGVGDMLSVTAKTEFFFIPEKSYPNAYFLPVFENGSFDTDPIDRLLASDGLPSPLPERSGSGRANPFAI